MASPGATWAYYRHIATELLLRYPGPSEVGEDQVQLTTTQSSVRFDGFVEHPTVVARSLVCVGQIARARFYPEVSSGRLVTVADPVVTVDPGTAGDAIRVRFESFSRCCGVHARLDLTEAELDVRDLAAGTTNVDFGDETVAGLSATGHHDALRLLIGADSLTIQTARDDITERRVPLPDRWVKGFGEVQVAAADARPLLRMEAATASRFLRGLPRSSAGRQVHWMLPAPAGVRLARRPSPGAVCLAAPTRLQALVPLAGMARSLTAYASPANSDEAGVIWVLELPGSRISLTLSPSIERGYSGEGGLLYDLASPRAATDAQRMLSRVAGQPRFSIQRITEMTGLSSDRARAAVTKLGAQGELGFDAVDAAFFQRQLPYPKASLTRDPPRLRDARKLLDAQAVHTLTATTAQISSRDSDYLVSHAEDQYRCTCPWIARHGTSRGPCKHILAYILSTNTAHLNTTSTSNPISPNDPTETSAPSRPPTVR